MTLLLSMFQSFADMLSPRNVRQDSKVVIENVSAMSGAGFHVKGNVYISVGHSVHSLPYWGVWRRENGWGQSQPCRVQFVFGVLIRQSRASLFPNWSLCPS